MADDDEDDVLDVGEDDVLDVGKGTVLDVGEEEEDSSFLEQLPGVRAVNVDAFEATFGAQIDAAISSHEARVEQQRLDKVRGQIRALEERLDAGGSKLAASRLAKLWERMDELQEEEGHIMERIQHGALHAPAAPIAPAGHAPRARAAAQPTRGAAPRKRETPTEEGSSGEGSASEAELIEGNVEDEPLEGNVEDEDDAEDDFDDETYRRRLEAWQAGLHAPVDLSALLAGKPLGEQRVDVGVTVGVGEGLQCPKILHDRLLEYQKTGVAWMARLFGERLGGILGDEMGLGKTVQVVAYVAALQASGRLTRPVLVVCPVTLMKQWLQELHAWWPPLRVLRLHSSDGRHGPRAVLQRASRCAHVLITSYGHLRLFRPVMAKKDWRAVVLDEGHKIRNPDAAVTVACKQLRTPHRLILSGTPIQNSLQELWSLFDFVYPGRLGTLPVFRAEFAQPISSGGYVNASSLQVQTSYRCACLLRDLIQPHLLRRVKADVAHELPPKQEQVLFCELSPYQRDLYEFLLDSDVIRAVLAGRRNILAGIDLLRKACNHPGLLLHGPLADFLGFPEPYGEISGKMTVLGQTLRLWRQRGHRVLLFCQTRQMLDLVEAAVQAGPALPYLRMDGNTAVRDRGTLVDRFNGDPGIFVFLLTTRVGGLGLNLTGADRVLIFDPDWNPSTDLQARERAWRLGQTRPVTIYRLITAGTIEEKIYQRQLWKQYLTNRVLSDPKQSRFFKSSDLHDLFSLAAPEQPTETGEMFSGLDLEIRAQQGPGRARLPQDDSHILDSLFEMTGLHSAIRHDQLMDRPRQETVLVEREAARLAAGAAEALRRSREERQAEPLEQATWTGRPVRPAPAPRGPLPSSAAILAAVRGRQQAAPVPAEAVLDQQLARVLERLLRLFEEQRGVCRSDMIAERFRDVLQPGQETAFRHLLKTIARFDAVSRTWRLHAGLLT